VASIQAQQSPQTFLGYTTARTSAITPHSAIATPTTTQLRHSGSNPQMQQTMQYSGMQGMGQGYPHARASGFTNPIKALTILQPIPPALSQAPRAGQDSSHQDPETTGEGLGWTASMTAVMEIFQILTSYEK